MVSKNQGNSDWLVSVFATKGAQVCGRFESCRVSNSRVELKSLERIARIRPDWNTGAGVQS